MSIPASPRRTLSRLWRYWLRPAFPLGRVLRSLPGGAAYLRQWRRYAALPGAEPLALADSYPCLHDAASHTAFDAHYLYQAAWAARLILQRAPRLHLDLGSDLRFVSQLAASADRRVVHLDLRPPKMSLPGLDCAGADLLRLPLASAALTSLSCLHVVEHIGLGRYGDRLEPHGTALACAELSRVLAPGGDLYFSLPVGRPRTEFNAHRVHAPQQVLAYFPALELAGFAAVLDDGAYCESIDPAGLERAEYACGLFHLRKAGPA